MSKFETVRDWAVKFTNFSIPEGEPSVDVIYMPVSADDAEFLAVILGGTAVEADFDLEDGVYRGTAYGFNGPFGDEWTAYGPGEFLREVEA